MKRFSLLVMILFFVLTGRAQSVTPKPAPTPPDDDVVKISTSLIQLDVSVTDAKGKVITDIKPEELEVYENGQKQKITNFSFVSAAKTVVEKPQPVDKNAIPLPPRELRPDQVRRTYALVVDDLSLSFDSAYYTRRALKKFVDEQMQDGDLVAIIRTGAGIGALQQFTSDKRLLYAAIEKVKWNPNGTGGLSAFAPIEPAPDTSLQTSGEDAESTDDAASATGDGQSLDDFRNSVFATGTLGALKYIVTGMAQLPGRKSVILFSDGFSLFETDEEGFQNSGRVMDFMRELVDAANRAAVVFYTIDARGLAYTGFTAADAPSSSQQLGTELSKRSAQLSDTQDGLSFLASETGGFDVKNSNDLSGGVRRVLEDQSYYLVAYEPDSDTFDAEKRKFNKLEVKVLRKGAKVRYRSGFFNVAEREKPAAAVAPDSAKGPAAMLEYALVSPFAVSGIDLRLNALFGSDAKIGTFVRSVLHVDAKDFKFTDEKDGVKKAVFDVLAMSFGDNGQSIDRLGKTYTLELKPEAYKKIMADGFVYHFTFPVKKPGAYQYRVALRDVQGGKIGSASQFIEVPNLKKKRLTASSIVLQVLTEEEWKRFATETGARAGSDPMADTALRRIRVGSVVRYGYRIFNAKAESGKPPSLKSKVRVFREGQLILDGKETPVDTTGQTDLQHLATGGAFSIGGKMQPGDYILQVIVIDDLAKSKNRIATQFVQFEVVE